MSGLIQRKQITPEEGAPDSIQASARIRFGAGFPYQPNISYAVFIIEGIDANGHTVMVKGSVKLIQEQGETQPSNPDATAQLELTFEPNPVPCTDGYWEFSIRTSEKNGVNVDVKKMTLETYDSSDKVIKSDPRTIEPGSRYAFIPANNSMRFMARIPCDENIAYVVFIIEGVDANGHTVMARESVNLSSQ